MNGNVRQYPSAAFRSLLGLLATSLLWPMIATAADAPAPSNASPTPVSGTIVKIDAHTLTLKTTEREDIALTLTADTKAIENKPAKLSDVRAGEFIGTTAVLEKDGKLHSREIHIFPESMRGSGEGHRPMGNPGTTMTNGSISTMTNGKVSAQNQTGATSTIKVSYQGGEKEIEIGPDVSITRVTPSGPSALKTGMHVMVFADQVNGARVAKQIVVTSAAP